MKGKALTYMQEFLSNADLPKFDQPGR